MLNRFSSSDYFACGKLDVNLAKNVISGIKKGCDISGCALIGGETAEMPGFLSSREYDLAGFAVGSLEKGKEITGKKMHPGDVVIALLIRPALERLLAYT